MKNKEPIFLLHEVHLAAKSSKFFYAGRKVRNDILNLEYRDQDVAHCLLLTSTKTFKQTVYFENPPPIMADEYLINYTSHKGKDMLYIKISLDSNKRILIHSFHP